MSAIVLREIEKLVDCLFDPELFKTWQNSLGFCVLNEMDNYNCSCKWATITLTNDEIDIQSKFNHVKTHIEDYINSKIL